MVYPRRVLTLISSLLLCSVTAVFLIGQCDSANILVLEGVPSPSHHLWMRTLEMELVQHGHNVTALSCDVEEEGNLPKNLTYLYLDQVYATLYAAYQKDGPQDVFPYAWAWGSTWTKLILSRFWTLNMFRGTLKSRGFEQLLNYPDNFPFDLIIYDTITSPAMMVFLDKFSASRVISVTPFPLIYPTNYITGALYMPAVVPNQNLAKLESGFLSRLNNFFLTWAEHYYVHKHLMGIMKGELAQRKTMKRTIEELYAKTQLIMPNYHPSVNQVQPSMPMIVPVGGLQIKASSSLPPELEEIFSSATIGVVYFSLGSNIQSEQLGPQRLTEIVEAFRALPEITFLWKINVNDLELNLPPNVHVRKWCPQNDILAHNKTLLFISHGGGLSTQETTWWGVPMLGVPVYLDQHPNVNLAVDFGTAKSINLKDIDRVQLKEAIAEMISNPKYRTNARLRSTNFRDQKEHPLQRAIWWIDYTLRNPDISFLKHASLSEMNVFAKHSMDVIAFLTILIATILYATVRTLFKIYHHTIRGSTRCKRTNTVKSTKKIN